MVVGCPQGQAYDYPQYPPAPTPVCNARELYAQGYAGTLDPATVHLNCALTLNGQSADAVDEDVYSITFNVDDGGNVDQDYDRLRVLDRPPSPIRPAGVIKQTDVTWVIYVQRAYLLTSTPMRQGRLRATLRRAGQRDVDFTIRYCSECRPQAKASYAASSQVPVEETTMNVLFRPGSSGSSSSPSFPAQLTPSGWSGHGRQQRPLGPSTSQYAMQLEDELSAGLQRWRCRIRSRSDQLRVTSTATCTSRLRG
jgi:hypothetical protein